MEKLTTKRPPTKLLTYEEAHERYRLSRATLNEFAERCKAVRRFGRGVRYDMELMDAGLKEQI